MDRPADPFDPEIEITPAMIAAGVSVLCAFDTTFEQEAAWAIRIYSAMTRAKVFAGAQDT